MPDIVLAMRWRCSERHGLEEVRSLLDHTRLDTTQIFTTIRPRQLRQAVALYDDAAQQLLKKEP